MRVAIAEGLATGGRADCYKTRLQRVHTAMAAVKCELISRAGDVSLFRGVQVPVCSGCEYAA